LDIRALTSFLPDFSRRLILTFLKIQVELGFQFYSLHFFSFAFTAAYQTQSSAFFIVASIPQQENN
jgi:hypothetical protein